MFVVFSCNYCDDDGTEPRPIAVAEYGLEPVPEGYLEIQLGRARPAACSARGCRRRLLFAFVFYHAVAAFMEAYESSYDRR